MQLTVMPVSAYSFPITLVSPITAALEVEYANIPALPSFSSNRGYINNAPIIPLQHVWQDSTAAKENAFYVDFIYQVKVVSVHFVRVDVYDSK